jgi:hypothetical protein
VIKAFGLLIVMILTAAAGSIAPALADGNTSVEINAPAEAESGSSFTATIDISEVTDLNAVQYDISFDPLVLRLDGIDNGQIGSKIIVAMPNELEAGHWIVVQYPVVMTDTVSGSGHLAVLHFHIIGNSGDSINLMITSGILSGIDGEIPATWNQGMVKVFSAASQGQPSPTRSTAPTVPTSDAPPPLTTPDIPPKASPGAPDMYRQPESGQVAEVSGIDAVIAPAPDVAAGAPATERVLYPPTILSSGGQSNTIPLIICIGSGIITVFLIYLLLRPRRRY